MFVLGAEVLRRRLPHPLVGIASHVDLHIGFGAAWNEGQRFLFFFLFLLKRKTNYRREQDY